MATINWWAIAGYLLGLVSFAFAVYGYRQRRREVLHRQQRFEWTHVEAGVRQLCRWVTRDFTPDFFLAIPGAGVILTELAVIELGDKHHIFMAQQVPRNIEPEFPKGGHRFTTFKWNYWLPAEVLTKADKCVLVLDDYAQSGDTLIEVRRALEDAGFPAANIRTAALIATRGLQESGKTPDFAWFWVDGPDVHMPWGHASKKIRTRSAKAV